MPSHMFDNLSDPEKVCHLQSESRISNYSAKVCQDILSEQRKAYRVKVLNVFFCLIY